MGAFMTGVTIALVTVAMGVAVTVYAKFKLLYLPQRIVAYAAFALMYLRGTVDYFYPFPEINYLRLGLALLVGLLFWFCERLEMPAGVSKAIEVTPIGPGMKADRKTKREAVKNEKAENGGVKIGGLTPGYVYGESKGSLWEL